MAPSFRRLRSARLPLLAIVLSSLILFTIMQNRQRLQDTLSYATRPIWDRSSGPSEVVRHFYGEGLRMDTQVCQLHGWKEREDKQDVKVLDAVLMSTELDLLEIRMNELDSVVDYFLIVESNATFTGIPKETYFSKNRVRFAKFDHKIVYRYLPGYALRPGQSPWDVEAHTRNTMTSLIRSHLATLPSNTKPLVIMSDLDEIPSHHTISLLKHCNFGNSIHLQLRDFLYSFEWYIGLTSWRASVTLWDPDSYYRHSKSGERMLADSGWHCSYCFRTIPEYAVKMQGFSHADRIAGRLNLLEPKRIQATICKGDDIFGMLPEAYSFLELWQQMNLKPLTSAIGLPRYLIENSQRFRFLLPGGCIRENNAS